MDVGQHFTGAVEHAGRSRIATEFAAFYHLPLIPIRAVAVFDLPDGSSMCVPLRRKLHLRSVIRGWVSVVPPLVCAGLALLLIDGAIAFGAVLLAFLVGAVIAPDIDRWLFRRPQPLVAARRNLRSRWLGAPAEVTWALFKPDRLEATVRGYLEPRLVRVGALRPGAWDAELVEAIAGHTFIGVDEASAAATLAEMIALREGSHRAGEVAERVWSDLFARQPRALDAEADFPAFEPENLWLYFDGAAGMPIRIEH